MLAISTHCSDHGVAEAQQNQRHEVLHEAQGEHVPGEQLQADVLGQALRHDLVHHANLKRGLMFIIINLSTNEAKHIVKVIWP